MMPQRLYSVSAGFRDASPILTLSMERLAEHLLELVITMKWLNMVNLRADLRPALRAFRREEDGAILVFGLIAFILMLMVGGIAVDMMRYESERVRLQGTADRAVLAAAMMRENPANPLPREVVRSYFAAEGFGSFVANDSDIVVNTDENGMREVTVTPQAQLNTTFMRLSGVDQLRMPIASGASEGLAQIEFEIVMVLDVSGSMRDNNRIENMRTAAIEFVREMIPADNTGSVAITFVPYSTEVIMPQGTLGYFTNLAPPVSGNLTNAFCIDFLTWDSVTDSLNAPMVRRNCALGDTFPFQPWEEYKSLVEMPVTPYLRTRAEAEAFINTLAPSWGTSIDLGVRTGAMFFDPTLRPIIDHLITSNQVSTHFANRPSNWNAPAMFRAMVLMTDGENCCFHVGDSATRKPDVQTQDADTVRVCNALKAQGVSIYAVAFEAPPGGVALMQNCASSAGHFFNSSGAQLVAAFRTIATHIQTQKLRLTQ